MTTSSAIFEIEFAVEERGHEGVISQVVLVGNGFDRGRDAVAVAAGDAPELQEGIRLCMDGLRARDEGKSDDADGAQKFVAFWFHAF